MSYYRYQRQRGEPDEPFLTTAELEEMEAEAANDDEWHAIFDAGLQKVERKLGRKLYKKEVQALYDSEPDVGDPDPVAAWNDLHPDGDPLSTPFAQMEAAAEEVFDAEREAEKEARGPLNALPLSATQDERSEYMARRMDGEEVATDGR